jgi:uncharacterized protein YdaU (DUF1376 family)
MSEIPASNRGVKGALLYHKRWHSDMLAEVINLDLRERGALFTLVDLMFVHGGSVPDEDDFMRRYLGCNARGWHTLRDRLLHLQKIYREGNSRLRSPLVDKGLREAQQRRDANAMAGMISQAKRQMTSKVVREFPKVSKFSAAKPLETFETASTSVQPYQTPDSRYKEREEKNAAPPPSSSFGHDAVVVAAKGSGEQSEITVSPYLAQQIQNRRGAH